MAVFARVVEAGGFTVAAQTLGVSKSTVSQHVARLEERLGARLLQRTTRRLALTEVGAAFYERCARIVAEAEEAELAVTRMQSVPRGTLRITAALGFGGLYLSPVVASFMVRWPELHVELSLSDRRVDLVEEGFDLAFRVGVLQDSSLIAKRLGSSRRVAAASPEYLARRGTPGHPSELGSHDCLLYSYEATGETWTFRKTAGGADVSVPVRGRLRSNNGDVLREGARAGLGICLLPSFFVADDIRQGRLQALLCNWTPPEGGVHALYPSSRHLSAKVRMFVDHAVEAFGSPPPWELTDPAAPRAVP
jgi:DNA-binding transcriptional LysR family regulator